MVRTQENGGRFWGWVSTRAFLAWLVHAYLARNFQAKLAYALVSEPWVQTRLAPIWSCERYATGHFSSECGKIRTRKIITISPSVMVEAGAGGPCIRSSAWHPASRKITSSMSWSLSGLSSQDVGQEQRHKRRTGHNFDFPQNGLTKVSHAIGQPTNGSP